jgi:hypothetical protein
MYAQRAFRAFGARIISNANFAPLSGASEEISNKITTAVEGRIGEGAKREGLFRPSDVRVNEIFLPFPGAKLSKS